jgi:hypothetical protein
MDIIELQFAPLLLYYILLAFMDTGQLLVVAGLLRGGHVMLTLWCIMFLNDMSQVKAVKLSKLYRVVKKYNFTFELGCQQP